MVCTVSAHCANSAGRERGTLSKSRRWCRAPVPRVNPWLEMAAIEAVLAGFNPAEDANWCLAGDIQATNSAAQEPIVRKSMTS